MALLKSNKNLFENSEKLIGRNKLMFNKMKRSTMNEGHDDFGLVPVSPSNQSSNIRTLENVTVSELRNMSSRHTSSL